MAVAGAQGRAGAGAGAGGGQDGGRQGATERPAARGSDSVHGVGKGQGPRARAEEPNRKSRVNSAFAVVPTQLLKSDKGWACLGRRAGLAACPAGPPAPPLKRMAPRLHLPRPPPLNVTAELTPDVLRATVRTASPVMGLAHLHRISQISEPLAPTPTPPPTPTTTRVCVPHPLERTPPSHLSNTISRQPAAGSPAAQLLCPAQLARTNWLRSRFLPAFVYARAAKADGRRER
ncbi:hypothetical protein MARPO_0136s0023 [Marchantia polymorpha]|uniref:Uncharacterized protein n=1 Tax=Marchantia polymorpha TaxID=3197 RepID=A0A2R6W762_MARPO|nr:hypothetical protein MARPO_0136s0023 [Marchantia polymorpha]|eukprot:PTQ29695.1 hypothetical protein MARPO_0136s0023 [Marchantia polymorpha]